MQNTGTKFAGRIVSEGSTAKTLKSAAGEEARARMNNLQRQDGIFGESWIDSPQISILMESKIDVQELIELHPGEFFSIFRGETVPSASFFIPDNEKSCSSDPVVINRYISVDAPRLDRLRRLVPRTTQRRIPSPENVSAIIGVLTAKPSRKRRKIRTEPHTIVDTFQQRIAGRQAAMAMLEEYDTDINARESALWETAVNTLKTTTREERRIRYITLNRPELPETKEENQISVRAERAGINLLTLPQDNNHPTGRPVNGFHHKKNNRPDWDGMY
ncbi:icmO-like type IV secretion system domain protein [Escherichia coli]|nr:icmO-like type IV secretion system domain protein [Escherichia coli]